MSKATIIKPNLMTKVVMITLCWPRRVGHILDFAGWYFVFNTLPFGWSPSAYVFHTSGLGASHFICSKNTPLSQYIDDRHVVQMRLLQCYNSNCSNIDLAKAAAFIASIVLVSCGYFIGLKKSILSPVQVIPFLGFLSDSTKQAFFFTWR